MVLGFKLVSHFSHPLGSFTSPRIGGNISALPSVLVHVSLNTVVLPGATEEHKICNN